MKYALIGYASDLGGLHEGARSGPRIIRKRGLLEAILKLGVDVEDYGDITAPLREECSTETEIKYYDLICKYLIELHDEVGAAVKRNQTPLVLGGDHSLSIGSFSGLRTAAQQPVGLLWIDTHADVNTPVTSPSKCAFGMPVAALLGSTPGYFEEVAPSKDPRLAPENLVYVGLREVDGGERDLIIRNKIKSYTMREVDYYGIGKVIAESIGYFKSKGLKFAVSFDLDVLDPSLVPGTGTPKRGGLTFREAHLALELLAECGDVAMWEFVELNPLLDNDFLTADLTISLMESALGKSIL